MMTHSPLPRPSPKTQDFKARFGVVPDGPAAPQPKMTRLQARRAKKKRFRTGAVIFALLLGTAGAGAFLIGQDFQSVASFFKSKTSSVRAPLPEPPQAPAVAEAPPVVVPAPPPPAPAEVPAAAVAPPPAADVATVSVPAPVAAPPAETVPAVAPAVPVEPPAAIAAPPAAEPVAEAVAEVEPAAAPAVPEPVAEPAPQAEPAAVAASAPIPSGTEGFEFPASPVIPSASGTQTTTVAQSEPVAADAVSEPAQSVPLAAEEGDGTQVAVAVPVPEPAPEAASQSEPAAVAAAPVAGSAMLQGQVFRDCENCPELVVALPPTGLPPEQMARVTRPAGAPALTAFAVGRFEITFDDWGRCMAGGGCAALPSDEGWGRNARPVINVSHDDATAQYIAWLSRMTGVTYRLPTSAEWDFAEMGGGIAPSSSVPLIDAQTICQSGNYATGAGSGAQDAGCADGFPTTAPAGSMKANALGLHDMRGNVWEWVSDCWTPGFTYKVKDSERDCHRRLLRGGSWSSRATLSNTAARGFEDATRATKTIGFRVARSLP